MNLTQNDSGFVWGPVEVKRITSHHGQAILAIETNREIVYVRITPTGLLRVDPVVNKRQALKKAGKR